MISLAFLALLIFVPGSRRLMGGILLGVFSLLGLAVFIANGSVRRSRGL